MFNSLTRIVAIVAVVGFVAGCANTIRGVGQDTAQTVDATQQAASQRSAVRRLIMIRSPR